MDAITGLGTESKPSDLTSVADYLVLLKEEQANQKSFIFDLGRLRAAEGYIQHIGVGGELEDMFPIDQIARRALGRYLDIPVPYLSRIPNSLAEVNIQYQLEQSPDVQGEFIAASVVEDEAEHWELREIKDVDSLAIEPVEVFELLDRISFLDERTPSLRSAHVANVAYGLHDTVIDIVHEGVLGWPAHDVGDVTYGGLRIKLPRSNIAPEVGTYLHRLICSNGAVAIQRGDAFSIAGMSRQEIMESLEITIKAVWSRVPLLIHAAVSLTEKIVENPVRMTKIYGAENGVAERFITAASDFVDNFQVTDPEKVWTLYDILQVYTSLAHLETAKSATVNKLQTLGGNMVLAAADEHRCPSCSHLVV